MSGDGDAGGDRDLPRRASADLDPDRPSPCRLSARELEILELIAGEDLSGKQVAIRLGLSASTVRTHLANAAAKVGARNTLHAVVICLQAGWLAL